MAPEPDVLDTDAAGRAVVRGGALRAGGYAVGALTSLVSVPLLVRHLGVEDFGAFVTVLSLVNIVALGTELGLTSVALREYAVADEARRADVLRSILGLRLATTAGGVLVALGFALLAGYEDRLLAGTAIAGAGLFALAYQEFVGVGLNARLRFGWVTAVETTRSVVATAATLVLIAAGASLLPFFAVGIVASLAAVIVGLAGPRGGVAPRPRVAPGEWRALLAATIAFSAATAVYVVYFRAVILIMSVDAPAAETGLFATSYRVLEFLAVIPSLMATTVLPVLARAAQNDPGRLRSVAQRVVHASVVSGAGLALFTALAAPSVMEFVGAPEAADVLRIQAAALFTTFTAFAMGAPLLALQRYRALLLVNLAGLAVAVAAALVLIPGHGAQGGAVAVLIGEGVVVLGQAAALVRAGVPLSPLAPGVAAVALAAGAGIGAFLVVPLPNLAAALAAALVYLAGGAALRQLPRELRELVRPG